jgi:hypothetical protein
MTLTLRITLLAAIAVAFTLLSEMPAKACYTPFPC